MNLKKLLVVSGCTLAFVSCGENSSKNEDKDKTDTSHTQIVTPPANTPVNTSVEVPEATKASFQAKYPTASNVTWKKHEPIDWFDWAWAGWPVLDSSDYMVTYTDDGVEYWTWYDDKNNWVGTTSVVKDQSGLPAAVSKAVNTTFPGYTIKSVNRENDKDRTAYEIKLEKGDSKAKLLVDEKGKVMKKSSIVDGNKTKNKSV